MEWQSLQLRARVGQRALIAVCAMTAACIGIALAQDARKEQPTPAAKKPEVRWATGVVFDDRNSNGKRDGGEPGISGARVSNQHQVVATDDKGAWKLAYDDDTTFFVVKPRGWKAPLNEHNLPRFFYHHRPAGSPKLRFGGIAATGDLPASIDFPLVKADEPDKFEVLFFADPQPYNLQQVDYVANDVVQEVIGTKAAFGVTLGDIVGNDLNLFGHINAAISRIGVPWYNVIGNHDIDFDSPNDADSDETFRRVYGPNYCSWDYGRVHFVALDDVYWDGKAYIGYLPDSQLAWLAEDLKHVPPEQLVVLLMHIPLTSRQPLPTMSIRNRANLYEIIKSRSVLALSGHTHTHHHMFVDAKDGWQGENALEHAHIVTVSGNWWRGDPDERGIPHATMRCGGPNGYIIATFDGGTHSLRYKAAGRPDEYQMLIEAPDAVWSDRVAGLHAYANVFGGSERSVVEWRIGGEWRRMDWTLENDPRYTEMARAQELSAPMPSNHLWKAALPEGLAPGSHLIEVRAADVYGQRYEGRRMLRVMDANLRPEIESVEPAVLLPGGEVMIKCSHLPGNDVQIMIPNGPGHAQQPLKVQRNGNAIKAKLPPTLNAGSLRVRSDLMLSDERLFEFGSTSPNGLRAEYFRLEPPVRSMPDFDALTPTLVRRDATVDFGDRAAFALPFNVNFGVRWTGQLEVAQAGEYAFALNTDDGSRLWINGEQVIDNAEAQGLRQKIDKITLGEGNHDIRIEYFQRGGQAVTQLKWRPPGVEKGVAVPTEALLPPKASREGAKKTPNREEE